MTSPASPPFQVGTLRYGWWRMLAMCVAIALAILTVDFLNLRFLPAVMPKLLDRHHISRGGLALLLNAVPALLILIINPICSTWSDRARTRWGRRIPFLMLSAPPVALFAVLIAFEPQLTGFLLRHCLPHGDPDAIALILLAVFFTLNQAAFVLPGSIVYYIYPDVLPLRFIGLFMGVVTFVNTIGAYFLYDFILAPAIADPPFWFVLVALAYLASMLLLYLAVREGTYPPPDTATTGVRAKVTRYFRDCFRRRIYIMLFLANGMLWVADVGRISFNLLFATQDLHLTNAQYGHIMGIGSIAGAVLVLLAGALMGRIHPLWLYLHGSLFAAAAATIGYAFAFHPQLYAAANIAILLAVAILHLACTPLQTAIFPREKFGQFASANAMLRSLAVILLSYLCGWLAHRFGYRVIFLWETAFRLLTALCVFVLYLDWKKYGGKHYTPPE